MSFKYLSRLVRCTILNLSNFTLIFQKHKFWVLNAFIVMTTRRRRAGSSECEETQDPAAALQTPVNSQVWPCVLLFSYFILFMVIYVSNFHDIFPFISYYCNVEPHCYLNIGDLNFLKCSVATWVFNVAFQFGNRVTSKLGQSSKCT